MLALANVAVAALQFYEPVLFGKVVDLLSSARDKPVDVLWSEARELLVLWAAVGIGGIVANIIVLPAGRPHGPSPAAGRHGDLLRARAGRCPSPSTTASIRAGC